MSFSIWVRIHIQLTSGSRTYSYPFLFQLICFCIFPKFLLLLLFILIPTSTSAPRYQTKTIYRRRLVIFFEPKNTSLFNIIHIERENVPMRCNHISFSTIHIRIRIQICRRKLSQFLRLAKLDVKRQLDENSEEKSLPSSIFGIDIAKMLMQQDVYLFHDSIMCWFFCQI